MIKRLEHALSKVDEWRTNYHLKMNQIRKMWVKAIMRYCYTNARRTRMKIMDIKVGKDRTQNVTILYCWGAPSNKNNLTLMYCLESILLNTYPREIDSCPQKDWCVEVHNNFTHNIIIFLNLTLHRCQSTAERIANCAVFIQWNTNHKN